VLGKEQKVFGLGLSKTATSSLAEALNILGIKTIHYPYDAQTYKELRAGIYKLGLMWEWQGAVDISIAPFFAQLDKEFPKSKFILTVRDKDSWLHSCEQHWLLMKEWRENFPDFKRFQEFISAVVYGVIEFNADRFSWAYDRHVEAVREYFKGRESDFLDLDICGGEGWRQLCKFLDCDVPKRAFPHANEWMHLLMEAKKLVEKTIPARAKVLLIDQAGFGNSFSNGLEFFPFLENSGAYGGLPETDEIAVSEFKRMQNQGIEFVVVGFPCFWWLDYYPTLSRILRQQSKTFSENRAVKIFDFRR